MTVRKASSVLTLTHALTPLVEREVAAPERAFDSLDWQGPVRLAADRASGLSAPRWQQQVRTGLLERSLSLGADHREGPHLDRPDVGRRLLAHVDALAEAGLSFAGLQAFSDEAELDNPGALWTVALLFGCLAEPGAEEAFAGWIASLDEALFLTYDGVVEIADALQLAPNAQLRAGATSWLTGASAPLAAAALETMSVDQIPADLALRLGRRGEPLVLVAMERLVSRSPQAAARPRSSPGAWTSIGHPALAHEIVRARLLAQDFDPLLRVRQRDAEALGALGPYAMEVLALAGDGSDGELAREIALGLPTTPGLIDAMGRAGLPALFPRLLTAIDDDEIDDEAHAALGTALGWPEARPSRAAWEHQIARLPGAEIPCRVRGGRPHGPAAVLEEMRRPELSARDLRIRADELRLRSARPVSPAWDALGLTLEGALSELSRLAR